MERDMKRLPILLSLVILLAFPSAVRADVAPPERPPGSNPQPGDGTTRVRMLAETVLIEVQPGAPAGILGQARVTTDFTMRNLSGEIESMAARFPIGASDGFSAVNKLSDLQIRVDGRSVPTRPITGEDPYWGSEPVPWVEFDVTFPPGEDVQIQVRYTLEASGEYPFAWFKYILSTGAGWQDSIGSADIIVRLPYETSLQNVLMDAAQGYFSTSPDGRISGKEIRWHYDQLEPTTQDNFEIELIMPSAWEQVLAERRNVEQNPGDGEAWGRLGRLYKQAAYSSRGKGFRNGSDEMDAGGQQLYGLSLEAYQKATTLLPGDALWHAGFAQLLAYHAYFATFAGEAQEAVRSLNEIRSALELAPADPKVLEIADEISYYFPEGIKRNGDAYDFPWLTATPLPPTPDLAGTSIAEVFLTATGEARPAAITATATRLAAGTPTSTPESAAGLPVCGGALLAPLTLVFARRRRRK
jgi:tetratricopeptide (TPR) repeat protein